MFGYHPSRESQRKRLLSLFEAHKGEPVPLPKILSISPRIAHHTQVISDLRDKGYVIACRHWNTGKEMHSEYTYTGIQPGVRPKEMRHKRYSWEEVEKIKDAYYEQGYQAAKAQLT